MKNNKGFSLVELIVVIAIMAILVGLLAPNLMKQLEKAKVSSDLEVLTTICTAIEYSIYDKEVMDDPDSQTLIDAIDDNTHPLELSELETNATYKNSVLVQKAREAAGVPDFTAATIDKKLKSTRGAGSKIMFTRRGSAINPIVMWITDTDIHGKKQLAPHNEDYTQITNEICLN